MDETKEKTDASADGINDIDYNKLNYTEKTQEINPNSTDSNDIDKQNSNDEECIDSNSKHEKIKYQDDNINKAIEAFNKNETNSLHDLASSLIGAMMGPNKEECDEENQNISQCNNSSASDTNEKETKTETETEIEYDTEQKNESEITLINVLTETDPIPPNSDYENSLNSIFNKGSQKLINGNKDAINEPTFQTGLDNPSTTKRPSSSQLPQRTSSTRITNRTRKVITSNSKRNCQRPSTSSGVRSSHQNSFLSENSSLPSEEELHAALDLMIQKGVLPDAEIRPEVINYARKLGSKKMLEESYDEAGEIDVAIDIMFTSIEEDRIKEEEIIKAAELQSRFDHAISKKKETQDKYIEMINDEQNRYKEKYDEIIKRHSLEIESFKDEWRNPDRVKTFNKPSSKLFQMRKQQKSMALLHDFQNAKQMKKMADQLEKQEADAALNRAKEAMKIEYQLIIERQQKELFCLKENHDKNMNTIKMSQGKDEELVQNTMQLLKFKIEASKTSRKPRLMVPVPKQRPTTSQSVPTTGMITYRTRSQLNNFRKESDKSRLPLKFEFVDQKVRKVQMQSQ